MSDLKHHPLNFFMPSRKSRHDGGDLSVEYILHAARFLIDRPPSADIIVLESADALMPFTPALKELAASSVDSNPLFETATLEAAMRHLDGGVRARVALVWSQSEGEKPRQLIGAFPYTAGRFYLGLPFMTWSIWTHIHSFLATPFVRSGFEHNAIRQFLTFADQSGAALMRFPLFQADGAFSPALTDVIAERDRRTVETERHERAFLDAGMSGDAYLAIHMRKKKRKEYNRLWNRLSELGELVIEAPNAGLDLAHWLQDFFALERSGWKGKRGTALAERPNERDFFESMCGHALADGKFHAVQITLNGKPIAMLASFVAGGGAYSFKIAYNEDYARYSPGALLMMKAIDSFHADPRIAWVDSCAIPNHPMIDHIWAERRTIREVNVATSHVLGPWLITYSDHMTRISNRTWSGMRKIYHRLRKEVERD